MNLVHHSSESGAFNLEHLALIESATISEVDDARRSNDDAIRSQQRRSLDYHRWSRCSGDWQGQYCRLPTLGVLACKVDQLLPMLVIHVEVLWGTSQTAPDR